MKVTWIQIVLPSETDGSMALYYSYEALSAIRSQVSLPKDAKVSTKAKWIYTYPQPQPWWYGLDC